MRFVRWSNESKKLSVPSLGVADHFIALLTRGTHVEGVVQFFGDLVHPIRLTSSYSGPPFAVSYIVDPFRESDTAELRNEDFDPAIVPHYENQSVNNDDLSRLAFQTQIERILRTYYALNR